MQWYEEWFDSPLYEKIYSNRDEEEANQLVEFLTRIIPKDSYCKILDLGCGRGRHSLSMGKRGYTVTGIDLSVEAITVARSKAITEDLQQVSFVVGDMREFFPETFDAVINLFTSFGYFDTDDQNAQVIRNVSRMLRPQGKLVLDYLNVIKAQNTLVAEEEGSIGNLNYTINRFVEDQTLVKKIHFRQKGRHEAHEFTERVKMYDKEWFERNLQKAGFDVQEVFGNYIGSEFNESTSSRLLLVAQKG